MEQAENTFDTAREDTVNMFEQQDMPMEEQEIPAEEETQPTEEQPAEEQPAPEMLEQAVSTAEVAAQAAQEKDLQLQQVMQEIQGLKQQNEQLQEIIRQQNEQQKEAVVEEALEPPMLDINALAFKEDAEVQAELAKYAQEMSDYARAGVMKEIAPYLEYAKEGQREREKGEILAELKKIPELQGIEDMMPQIENIIKRNPRLYEGVPLEDAIINAYATVRGVNAINEPPKKELTAEEFMELYNNNPEFKEIVEKQRLDEIKDSQQVPALSSSSGAVNAALNIPKTPETFAEASERTRKMFGK